MNLALQEAWKFQILTAPNPAVGCTVVKNDNTLLAVEAHKKAGLPHAEVLALQSAYYKLTQDDTILSLTASHDIHNFLLQNHAGIFHDCTLHVSLEPCAHEGKTPSCAKLIAALGVKKVVICSLDESNDADGGAEILLSSGVDVNYSALHVKGKDLLTPFLRQNQDHFVFFKWAQRVDGTIDGGVISSQASRVFVHQMRDVCDLLVIGGETVRRDRPTLDARLCNGKAPDLLILSRGDDFDRTIPLFDVAGRKVMIADDFEMLQNYKRIMIEGGPNMFKLSKKYVDYYLAFVALKSGGNTKFSYENESFELLHVSEISDDMILWMKLKQ